MQDDELRQNIIDFVTEILVSHSIPSAGSICVRCKKRLYTDGGGMTLSRHRAERIVDELGLVDALKSVNHSLTQ